MNPNSAAVVIMERGSAWPAVIQSLASSIVLPEDPEDTVASLLARMARRLRVDRISTHRVVLGVLACSARAESWQHARRSEIARGLLATVGAASGRVLLCAPPVAPPELRLQLLGIVGELVVDRPPSARASVAVRFGNRGETRAQVLPVHELAERAPCP